VVAVDANLLLPVPSPFSLYKSSIDLHRGLCTVIKARLFFFFFIRVRVLVFMFVIFAVFYLFIEFKGYLIDSKINYSACKLIKKKKSSIDLNSHLLFILPLRFFVIIQLARIHLTLDQLLLIDNVSPVVFRLLPFLIIKIIIKKKLKDDWFLFYHSAPWIVLFIGCGMMFF